MPILYCFDIFIADYNLFSFINNYGLIKCLSKMDKHGILESINIAFYTAISYFAKYYNVIDFCNSGGFTILNLLAKNINKTYENLEVIMDFSYEFVGGNVYKIEGRNGTGKSTLLRILSGLEQCESGTILVQNQKKLISIEEYSKANKILYLPDIDLCQEWLTIEENIEWLHVMSGVKMDETVELYRELNILEEDYKKVAVECSLGTRMKVGLSLLYSLYDYKLIFIDETLAHLDTIFREKYLKKLKNYAKNKNAVIFLIDHEDIDDSSIKTIKLVKGDI